ncbi:ferredoxin reductase family protein [Pseudarthrobacter sp. P1]|uniref:ferredoxin reductase family protein n=1 Tax=Pseudarthrobacter sp. P1 TaxID=3418418 RepID=UPI003CF70739
MSNAQPRANAAAPLGPERSRRLQRRLRSADFATVLCWLSVSLSLALYLAYGGLSQIPDAGSALNAAGVMAGLAGTDLILVMLILAARIPALDRAIGQDAAIALHRRLGKPTLYLILLHAGLLTAGYAIGEGSNVVSETLILFQTPDMAIAYLGLGLLIAVVVSSLLAVRRRFPYEAWHGIHLVSYVAVLVALPHQLSVGGVLAQGTWQRLYWLALYGLAFGSIFWFRFATPAWRSWRHGIRVERVEQIAPGVVSIHLAGTDLDRLGTAGGQYAIWRFWTGRTWWHAHPISFSAVPTRTAARITVRDLGRGSRSISRVRTGTRVSVEGPYGLFTTAARTAPYLAVVAAGIGVTPIRALLEDSRLGPGEATVLLRGTDKSQNYLWGEVAALTQSVRCAAYSMVGPRPAGAATWLSAEAMAHGVTLSSAFPRLADSDLYVCGPQSWADLVVRDAREAGLPAHRIHYERFDW